MDCILMWRLFVATRQDADFALRASKAYQDIVDALNSAREAAYNASIAADIAYEKVNFKLQCILE